MLAIREEAEQRVEGMMRDYDRMGELFQSNPAWQKLPPREKNWRQNKRVRFVRAIATAPGVGCAQQYLPRYKGTKMTR